MRPPSFEWGDVVIAGSPATDPNPTRPHTATVTNTLGQELPELTGSLRDHEGR